MPSGGQPCNGCRQLNIVIAERDAVIAERDLTINNLLAQLDRMERGIDAAVQDRCDRIVLTMSSSSSYAWTMDEFAAASPSS